MLIPRGYREEELVSNRASLLLYGGTEEERRAWAQEAAHHFEQEGALIEVRQASELAEALRRPKGVVLIADVSKLGLEAQGTILRCLQTQEERPKLVLGMTGSAESALERGALREDLHYRLHQAQVDLSAPGLREQLKKRWAVLAEQRAAKEAAEREQAERERQEALVRKPGTVTRLTPQQRKVPQAKAAPRKASRR
ncbi:Fis family transcriptional regulator [Hyalangium gracile]|uniref:Fis family transcriptional regulator n=1 Tax=Hyalangium gracile TaxID=394092 RepID=UPI00295E4FFA|nr:Fis family transcriptional regulator [Hyalangium gracile]